MRQLVRKISYCCLILLLCGGALAAAQSSGASVSSQVAKQPKAQVPQDTFNFATVPEGSSVIHDFVIKNGGDADLVIQRVIPACGCTVAKVEPETIVPKGEGKLHVEFDTSGFSGEKFKLIRVLTNDPETASLNFTIKGSIEPAVVIEPQRVVFDSLVHGNFAGGATKEFTIRLTSPSGRSLGAVQTYSKFLSVKEIAADSLSKRIAVTVSPDAPIGELRERVFVALGGSRGRNLAVPVFVTVSAEHRLVPSSVSFGLLEGSQPLERAVKLENLSKESLEIREIVSSNPAISGASKEIEKGARYVIKVHLDPTRLTPDTDLRATVTVITNRESLPLTVYGTFPPRS